MGELYDAPNQQVVRPDGSGPADEGTGGEIGDLPTEQAEQPEEPKQTEPQQAPEPQQAASEPQESSEASQERQRQPKGRRSA